MTNGINVLRNVSTYITFSENDHITKVSPCIALGFMLFAELGLWFWFTKELELLFFKTSWESLIVLTEALRLSNTLPSCGPGYGDGPSACQGSLLFNSCSSYWNILVFCELWYWRYSVLFCMSHVFNSAPVECWVLDNKWDSYMVQANSSESCYRPII